MWLNWNVRRSWGEEDCYCVISIESPCKDGNAQFTKVPFKLSSDHFYGKFFFLAWKVYFLSIIIWVSSSINAQIVLIEKPQINIFCFQSYELRFNSWLISQSLFWFGLCHLEITLTVHLKGVTGNVLWLNWICSIVDKFLRIHLRHIKRYNNVYLLSLSVKSTFKIMNLGGYVFRIVFLNYL